MKTCLAFIAMGSIISGSAYADTARIHSVGTVTGTCVNFFSNKVAGVDKQSISCDSTVSVLHFEDGYTSIQFKSQKNSGGAMTATSFIGPHWVNTDNAHIDMVVDQVVIATLPSGARFDKNTYSGFCLLTLDSSGSNSYIVYRCEYLSGVDFNIFTLTNITDSGNRGIKQ